VDGTEDFGRSLFTWGDSFSSGSSLSGRYGPSLRRIRFVRYEQMLGLLSTLRRAVGGNSARAAPLELGSVGGGHFFPSAVAAGRSMKQSRAGQWHVWSPRTSLTEFSPHVCAAHPTACVGQGAAAYELAPERSTIHVPYLGRITWLCRKKLHSSREPDCVADA
jgi:hypothetical protein